MSKALKWSSHEYDGRCRAYEAKIAQVNFKNTNHSFKLGYLAVEQVIGGVALFLECCEDPLFNIGSYDNVEVALNEADKHYKKFIKVISGLGGVSSV